jgi:hypothetical protein
MNPPSVEDVLKGRADDNKEAFTFFCDHILPAEAGKKIIHQGQNSPRRLNLGLRHGRGNGPPAIREQLHPLVRNGRA